MGALTPVTARGAGFRGDAEGRTEMFLKPDLAWGGPLPAVNPHRSMSSPCATRSCFIACRDGDMEAVNLDAMLACFAERWSPLKVARIDHYDVRIVKVRGEFTWHERADIDEFFLVRGGQLTIQLRDRNVVLAARVLFVVARGVERCPRAAPEPRWSCSSPAASSTPRCRRGTERRGRWLA